MLFHAAMFAGMFCDSRRKPMHLLQHSWYDLPLETWPQLARLPMLGLMFHMLSPPASQVALGTRVCLSVAGGQTAVLLQTYSHPQTAHYSAITEGPLPSCKEETQSAKATRLESVMLRLGYPFCHCMSVWPGTSLLSSLSLTSSSAAF